MDEKRQKPVSKQIRDSLERAAKQARKVGGRVAHAMAETPEYISLQRNDRALRSEMRDCFERIGKRTLIMHKRSRGESPFARYTTILSELKKLEQLEDEYRHNREKLVQVTREMKKGR